MLHEDREFFAQLVLRTAEAKAILPSIIEKDYYVTEYLRAFFLSQPNAVFKGGTSLSKCYHVIDRFSEDIDLNIDCDARLSEGQRKQLKRNIVSAFAKISAIPTNLGETRSRRDFNRYLADYSSVIEDDFLRRRLMVETMVSMRSFPCETKPVSSFVSDYLLGNGFENIVCQHGAGSFPVKVQAIERTFVDKTFALCDYYLTDRVAEHSRHLYDLYKILPLIRFDDTFYTLVEQVRMERAPHTVRPSAAVRGSAISVIKEIIANAAYREDYEKITIPLLFTPVPYDLAVSVLSDIVSSHMFS